MPEKLFQVSLEVVITGGGRLSHAIRTLVLPYVPFVGLIFELETLTVGVQSVQWNVAQEVFKAYSIHRIGYGDPVEELLGSYRESGFEVKDLVGEKS